MEEREPIQVSFRLPAGTLEGLSRLVEQLRLLAAEVGGGAQGPASPPAEYGRNEEFDGRRYEDLRQGAETEDAGTVRAEVSDLEEARAVRSKAEAEMKAPARAAEAAKMDASGVKDAEPVRADVPREEIRERPAAEAERRELQKEPAPVRTEVESSAEGPEAVRAEAERLVEEPAAVRMEPESQILAAEAAWAKGDGEELATQAVRVEAFSRGMEARSAGFTPVSATEETSGKWDSVAQELTKEGAAPLTAEAVSLAFRRDGRRYDNGFPLY